MNPAINKIKQLSAIAKKNAAEGERARIEDEAIARPDSTNTDHKEVRRAKTKQKFVKQIHSEDKNDSAQDQAVKKVIKQRSKKDGQVKFAKASEREKEPDEGKEIMETKYERVNRLHESVIRAAHKFGRSSQAGKPLAPHQKVRTHNFNSMGSIKHFFKHKVAGAPDQNKSVTSSAAYEHYCNHCDENNAHPHPFKKFHQEFSKHVKPSRISGRVRYVGIKLVESVEEDLNEAGMNRKSKLGDPEKQRWTGRKTSDTSRKIAYDGKVDFDGAMPKSRPLHKRVITAIKRFGKKRDPAKAAATDEKIKRFTDKMQNYADYHHAKRRKLMHKTTDADIAVSKARKSISAHKGQVTRQSNTKEPDMLKVSDSKKKLASAQNRLPTQKQQAAAAADREREHWKKHNRPSADAHVKRLKDRRIKMRQKGFRGYFRGKGIMSGTEYEGNLIEALNYIPAIHKSSHEAMLTKLINSNDKKTMDHIENNNMKGLAEHVSHHVNLSTKRNLT